MMWRFGGWPPGAGPDYRAIARFRQRHLSALGHLFVQALALCQAAGMVRLGRVALDGTKVRANASKRKAMSYARMSEQEKVLADEVSAPPARGRPDRQGRRRPLRQDQPRRRAARAAAAPGNAAGHDPRGEGRARERGRARGWQRAEPPARDRGDDEDTAAAQGAAAADAATPKPKAQRNFTDPDSKIMLTGDGAFHQCYNAQAVVDEDHQVIEAIYVNTNAAHVGNLIPMTEQTAAQHRAGPGRDARRCRLLLGRQPRARRRVQRPTRHRVLCRRPGVRAATPALVAARGPIPKSATSKQRMARTLTTQKGRAIYARRKAIVEPVFGQMSTLQNAKHLLLRGLHQARGEWLLLATCHNLRKLHGVIGVHGLGALAPT